MVRPADDFWPLARYTKKFGDPLSSRNRKLGHVKTVAEGVAGVAVPCDDGEGPWKLERSRGRRAELDKEEDVGSDGGDESEAERKFADIAKSNAEKYRAIAQGALSSILAECTLSAEESIKEGEKLKKARIQRKRRAKQKKEKVVEKKALSCFARPYDSDEDGDLSSCEATPATSKRTPGSASKAAGSTSTPKSAKKQTGNAQDGGDGVEVGDSEGENAGGTRKRGAPSKDFLSLSNDMWDSFVQAEESHASFGLRTTAVQKRLIVRWKGVLQNNKEKEKDESKNAALAVVIKKLQLMDMGIQLHMKWRGRGSDALAAFTTFETSFQSLESFAGADPPVHFQCKFLCGLRLQLKAEPALASSV